MGGKSSASTSTANTQQTKNTQNIDTTTTSTEVGAGGVGATGGRDVTVTNITSDQGSINAARDIATRSLGTAENVAQAGLDTGRKLGESSLDFAGEFGGQALALAKSSTSEGLHSALDYGTGVTAGAFDLVGKALSGAEKSSADTATTLSSAITAAGNATRSDSAATLSTITKYGAVALGVVVVAVAAIFIFKGKS